MTDDREKSEYREQPPDNSATGNDSGTNNASGDLPAVTECSNLTVPPRIAVPIVGVGASAGGLEAMQAFFSKVPADCGIAFVVVTHMRPGRESLLPELLRYVTTIPVQAADDVTRIHPNTITIAKDLLLAVSDGEIRPLKDDADLRAAYHLIDYFFRALARDQQEHAIGIILSGSGNDGTLGLRAIKAAGGMIMVQNAARRRCSR